MTLSLSPRPTPPDLEYPESDGTPMAESDPTRDYLIYGVSALSLHFQNQEDIYVSGNLYLYYEKGVPSAVLAPDVFVVKGVHKKKRKIYQVWQEGGKTPIFVLEVTSAKTRDVDEKDKPIKYQDLGVEEYFQYDPTGDYLQPPLKGRRLVRGVYEAIANRVLEDGSVAFYSEQLALELRLLPGGELRFFNPLTGERLLSHEETELARQQAEQARYQEAFARQQAEQARYQAEQALYQEALARQQAEQARQQAEQARQQAEQARYQAVPRLLEMGLTTEQIAIALGLSVEEVQNLSPPEV